MSGENSPDPRAVPKDGIKDGYHYDELPLGMQAETLTQVTEERIKDIAKASEDYNPLHFDEQYAKRTIFSECVAHGVLTAGFISATVASKLPGPGWAPIEIALRFRAPVWIGDMVLTRVTISKKLSRKRLELVVGCFVGDRMVVTGEITVADVRKENSTS